MPKISVVIPVRNRPVAVRGAIESVLSQTFQDFEIVVVDDHSTDDTAAAVEAFADPRVKLIRHDRRRGGSAARNTGIRLSSAPYVAFLDSDDRWLPTKLEKQLAVFTRSNQDLGLVYTGSHRIQADGSVTRYVPRPDMDLSRRLLYENVVGETSVGMVRRSAIEAIGGFDESLPSCQDMDLWLRLCERFRTEPVQEPLVLISKGDDGGRISANVPRTVRGRELYNRKHRAQMARRGVLYLHLRESGWWQQRRLRDAPKAASYYRESIAANPFAPLTYLMLLLSFVPLAWLDVFARWRHGAVALVQQIRKTPTAGAWDTGAERRAPKDLVTR